MVILINNDPIGGKNRDNARDKFIIYLAIPILDLMRN